MSATILIIEDERHIADLLAYHLEKEGYSTLVAGDGVRGLQAAREASPALIVLDLMIPGISGTEVCRTLRSEKSFADVPILMLTAKGEEIDRVVGFEVGADDYLVKPFSVRELVLRIRALLRRSRGEAPAPGVITVGPIAIDTERGTITVDSVEVGFTTMEFKLILYLAERRGRIQSRDLLLKNVWGMNYIGDTRTVDTHVTRIRNKLGKAGGLIKTIRGFGYKMEEA